MHSPKDTKPNDDVVIVITPVNAQKSADSVGI